jgi:hypothetical protein
MVTHRLLRGATRPLSRAGEGWGEGPGLSGEVASLTLSLSRTGEGTGVPSGGRVAAQDGRFRLPAEEGGREGGDRPHAAMNSFHLRTM